MELELISNVVHYLIKQTFGQAYDEMLTQNSRLLHQITERDDYNTQVFGDYFRFWLEEISVRWLTYLDHYQM